MLLGVILKKLIFNSQMITVASYALMAHVRMTFAVCYGIRLLFAFWRWESKKLLSCSPNSGNGQLHKVPSKLTLTATLCFTLGTSKPTTCSIHLIWTAKVNEKPLLCRLPYWSPLGSPVIWANRAMHSCLLLLFLPSKSIFLDLWTLACLVAFCLTITLLYRFYKCVLLHKWKLGRPFNLFAMQISMPADCLW